MAVSPEQLSLAQVEEVEQWLVVSEETELMEATPAAGTGFLDLHKASKPLENLQAKPEADTERAADG